VPVNWAEIVGHVRADGWRAIAGSHLEVQVPVRQPLLDYLLEGVTWPKGVRRVRVTLHEENHLSARVTVSLFGFAREFELKLRLASALDERRLIVFIENQALLAAALAVIGPALKLPPGVTIDGARIVVDLEEAASSRHAGDVVAQLETATFETRDGALWVNAVVHVHAVDAVPVVPSDSVPRLPISLPAEDVLVGLLRGARAEWRLRVAESLANQLLRTAVAAVRDSASASATDTAAWRPLLDALRSLEVRFEDGVAVFSGSAAID
jgi:hypothetical protein